MNTELLKNNTPKNVPTSNLIGQDQPVRLSLYKESISIICGLINGLCYGYAL